MTDHDRGLNAAERKWIRRRRRWTKRLGLGTLLAGLAAGSWAFEAGSAGLNGILPAEVPQELTAEALDALGPTWSQWSQETAAAVAELYKAEGDAASQRQQISALKSRLSTIETALRDSRYASIRNPLLSVRGPLARRIAVAEAVLDTLEVDPQAARAQHISRKTSAAAAALSALENDVRGIPGGSAWLTYIKAEDLRNALKNVNGDGAVEALNTTVAKLAKRDTLTDPAQKEFLSRPTFIALENAVSDLVHGLTAPVGNDNTAAVREELARLLADLEFYEATGSGAAAAAVRASWSKVKNIAPDHGDRLEAVLSTQYYNYNLRLVASEAFLSRLLSDSRVESGQVVDFVLGANVGGQQTTSTNVSIDLKPSADRIRFDLVLNGTVQSSTAGATSQATIYTQGYHTFTARKEVQFDGNAFRTLPGTIGVNANNTTTGATTRYSGGLFGRMAERIAYREAEARRPQAEAIAQSRVAERVMPRFNAEADRAFADSSRRLETELNAGLRATGLYPDAKRYQSTDNSVRVSTRLMADGELGGSITEPSLLPESTGATLALHESLINNAIDRIGLNGQTMTEEELRHHVEGFLSKALSREFKFRSPEEAPAPAQPAPADEEEVDQTPSKLVFAEQDPIRVQIRDGLLLLRIRAGLKREGKEPIPVQEITAPIRFIVQGEQILATREGLDIVGVEGDVSAVQRKVMNTKISAALPDRAVSGRVELTGANNRKVHTRVHRITMADGWIALGLQ